MNWLARLKKTGMPPEYDATKPTKPGFVGFVAPIPALIQKTGGDSPAANELASSERHALQDLTKPNIAAAANDPAPDPDRWAWPHSSAMNAGEIDTFTARLSRFTDKGLSLADAEAIADKLVMRDRESDDRRLCPECAYLQGSRRCGNWQRAGVAIAARDAQLSAELVQRLQRCHGFSAAI